MQIQKILNKILNYKNLTPGEAYQVFKKFVEKNSPSSQIAGFLIGLTMKGETGDELYGIAKCMREYSKKMEIKNHEEIIDICGTGGDYSNTFNISTTASFIVSGAGICVAKHSSRAMTSTCGSADVLSKAGYNLNTPFDRVKKSIEEEGIGFLYAPLYHPMMKRIAKIRAQLGVITTFNIVGALSNPVNITHRLMGVNKKSLLMPVAEAIRKLGIKKALIVYSKDGFDEISIFDKTYGVIVRDKDIKEIEIFPEDFGIERERNLESIKVMGKKNALEVMLGILKNEFDQNSPFVKIVLANAGAGIYVMEKARDFKEGYEIARDVLLSGRAYLKFKKWLSISV